MYNEFEYFITNKTDEPLSDVDKEVDLWFLENEGYQIDENTLIINDELLLFDI